MTSVVALPQRVRESKNENESTRMRDDSKRK